MIDREACWKRSEVLCLPQPLTVGCQKSVFNIGLENQEIRITLDIFTGMNISCELDVFLTLSSLAVLVSAASLPLLVVFIFPPFLVILCFWLAVRFFVAEYLLERQLLGADSVISWWRQASHPVSHRHPRITKHSLSVESEAGTQWPVYLTIHIQHSSVKKKIHRPQVDD